jgi:uncharacterized phage protein gp47/JayE
MALNIPSTVQLIFDRLRSDAQQELTNVNVWTRNNFFSALLAACAGRFRALYQVFVTGINEAAIPITARDEYLDQWAELRGITRLPASSSKGYVNFPCIDNVTITEDTVLRDDTGLEYIVQSDSTDTTQVLSLASLTRVGNTATATTSEPHGFATGQTVTISGASQSAYNKNFVITATSNFTFTFTVSGNPTTPATGTILATSRFITVEVESAENGVIYNKENGATISISTPLPFLNDTGYVVFDGLNGGADEETDSRLQFRNKLAWQNPIALFSKTFLEQKALELSFVERVFVQEITPGIGDTTIYFTSNTTANAQPTATEISAFQKHMSKFKPAHMSSNDYVLNAASAVPVNITISSLVPNNGTLKTAINETLREWFNLEVEPGQDILVSQLYGVIYRTTDVERGENPRTFIISLPSGSVSIALNQKAVLGSVTYT